MPESWLKFFFIFTELNIFRNDLLPEVDFVPLVFKLYSQVIQNPVNILANTTELETVQKISWIAFDQTVSQWTNNFILTISFLT